jgi:hypothetical protein
MLTGRGGVIAEICKGKGLLLVDRLTCPSGTQVDSPRKGPDPMELLAKIAG